MDAQSKELLTWALVKVAESGSRVVALHVITNSSLKSDPDGDSPSAIIALVKAFDSVLAVYEGFCNLKQIDLKLKICRGSSIRKVLVREVNGFGAAKLILGVTKQSRGIGPFSTSIAKYCAKKLPRECWVVAVNNGKIVFQTEATQESKGTNRDENSKFLNGNNDNYCLLPTEKEGVDGGSNTNGRLPSSINLSEQSCSICSPSEDTDQGCLDIGAKHSSLPVLKIERELLAVPRSAPASPDVRPGWSNIRRAFLQSRKSSKNLEKTKISAVQWAMRLSTRYSTAAAVHPDRKSSKLDKKGRFDYEGKTIIPLAANATNLTDTADVDGLLEIPKELVALQERYASTCRLFTYQELADATSDFTEENLIGKGGTSHVYKGRLPDGRKLAVKILMQTEDALREFAMEIEIITTLSHQNIISLLGFSFGKNKLLLVYDLLSRGSLEENLHGVKSNKKFLSWTERYKIAVGVAEALDYLHSGSSSLPAIHKDVKSSNILLTKDFEPQLSDFGLATWASSASAQLTCNDVAGTFGYLAPEYFMFGRVNEKIDVYAFGVVLLELLSGRKPISNEFPKGQQSLIMWAKPNLQNGKGKLLLDPSLSSEYDDAQLERMISAASLCIRRSPKLRPKMPLILKLLRGEDDAIKWARIQLVASEELEGLDEDATYSSTNNIQSHISLALLDVEDDMLSDSTNSHSVDYIMAHSSLEAYLQGRCSRSSSFD